MSTTPAPANEPEIPHLRGCSRPERRRFEELHRCPECKRGVQLRPPRDERSKPHEAGCPGPDYELVIGRHAADLYRICANCRGAFALIAAGGTYDADQAQALIAEHKRTPASTPT